MGAAMDGTRGLETVADRVRHIIAQQAVVDMAQVTDTATLDSLGMDSLALVETIFSIEETFDVSVPFNANDPGTSGFDLSSVGAIIGAVEALIAAR